MTAASALLVITGPTASGKSRLGVEVAAALEGEIISVDAVAVYRGLDVGSDKPGPELMRRVPHHLIDCVDPRERFSAGRFVAAAETAIDDIRARGRTPILVGGTLFYLRALLLGLFPSPPRDQDLVRQLNAEWRQNPDLVWQQLRAVDPTCAARVSSNDRQRVVRALEVYRTSGIPLSHHWHSHHRRLRYPAMLVAPDHDRAELYARIDARVDRMFASDLVGEVQRLLAAGVPEQAHAFTAIGYRQVVGHLAGRWDLATAVAQTKLATRRLAKRQLSWLRHLSEGTLHWVASTTPEATQTVLALVHDVNEETEAYDKTSQ